ncbi:MAG: DHH family phosphoesterase [Bacteroidales bacterium]|nr:DHH family phosphoesterase [Bacteroidales bacterium]
MRVTINEDKLHSMVCSAGNIVIFGHENPDGDSIGSAVGMYHYLTDIGKRAHIVIASRLPDNLDILIPEGSISYYSEDASACGQAIAAADLLIFLDMNGVDRAGAVSKVVDSSAAGVHKVLIDHHLGPKVEEFDVVISDTEVSSACELLYQVLLQQSGVDGDIRKLSIECVTAIMAGILTDTNNFANSVYPSTYLAVSALQARGVDRDSLYDAVFRSYSRSRMRLMGYMLKDNMRFLDPCVAFFTLSMAEKETYGFLRGDSEGFVNLPLSIKDVQMTALFTEDVGYIKVSLRSKGNIDVNDFAHRYCNGGGHKNASGGKLYMPLEQVPDYFECKVKEFFAQ